MRLPLLLLALLLAFPSSAALSLRVLAPEVLDANLLAEWRVVLANDGGEVEEKVRLRFSTRFGRMVSMPESCTTEPAETAICTVDVEPLASRELVFVSEYDRRSGRFRGTATTAQLFAYDEAVFGREFVVTSTADDGEGSLRRALADVTRDCAIPHGEPCVVVFRIDPPVPPEGFFTIRPRTPLPPMVTPDVFIAGASQSRHTGDTSPGGGTEIVIDGSEVSGGHGLLFTSRVTFGRVTDLSVRNFPGNGIESHATFPEVLRNRLESNGLRGVQLDATVDTGRVEDNVLSFNRRAGGFFWTARSVRALRNVVIGNGASGLFFHKPLVTRNRSDAEGNVIEHNAHAGIALSNTAVGDFARNRFRFNGSLPIDIGLDGDSREVKPGLPGQGGRVGAPTILSVRFDGTATVIEGRVAPRHSLTIFGETVYLYASASPENADELLARVTTPRNFFDDGTFTARIERDLRGLWLRAATYVNYAYNWDDPAPGTSELSEAVKVE